MTLPTLSFASGDAMPMIGLGTWKSQPGDVYGAVKSAIHAGYRHIDCAYIYGNEAEIGQGLSEVFADGIVNREQLWITSKLWNDAHRAEDVPGAVQKTLADLQLDYLDLYLIHWPVCLQKGASFPLAAEDFISLTTLPIAETWGAMEALVEQGLIRHIGVSNFSVAKLQTLLATAQRQPELNQVEGHPYLQQPALLQFCRDQGIHLTAYSPLGSPDRPDSLKAPDEPILLRDPTLAAIAQQHQATPAQVLIRWAIQRGTAVIPKSVTPARIAQNLAASDLVLTPAEMAAIAALDKQRRYVDGAIWVVEGGPYTQANLWDA